MRKLIWCWLIHCPLILLFKIEYKRLCVSVKVVFLPDKTIFSAVGTFRESSGALITCLFIFVSVSMTYNVTRNISTSSGPKTYTRTKPKEQRTIYDRDSLSISMNSVHETCVCLRVYPTVFAYIFNSQSQELKTKRQRSNIGQRNFRVQPEFAHIFKSQALNTYHPKEVVILTNFKLNFDVTLGLYNDLYQTTLPNYQRNCKTLHTFTLNTLNVCVYIYKMKSINNSIRNTSVSKMARSARRIVGSLTFVHTQKVQFWACSINVIIQEWQG